MIGSPLAVTLVASALSAAALSAADPKPAPADAAAIYRKAFAKLPQLTDEENGALFIDTWPVPKWTEPNTKLLAKFDESLALLHRGADARECDWKFDVNAVLGKTEFPHLKESHTLMKAACLRANLRFSRGDAAGAVADCLATMAFGRRFGAAGLMVHGFHGQAAERSAIAALAEHLTNLKPDELRSLSDRLDKLLPPSRYADCLAAELKFCAFSRRSVRNKIKAGGNQAAFEQVIDEIIPFDFGGYRKSLREAADGSFATLGKLYEAGEAFNDEEFGLFDLPWSRFKPAADALDKRAAASANPLIKDRLVSLTRTKALEFGREAEAVMLRAAVAVLLDGPDALKQFPDPCGDGPFTLVRPAGAGKGFELRSKLTFDGEPVKLRVGLPPEVPKE